MIFGAAAPKCRRGVVVAQQIPILLVRVQFPSAAPKVRKTEAPGVLPGRAASRFGSFPVQVRVVNALTFRQIPPSHSPVASGQGVDPPGRFRRGSPPLPAIGGINGNPGRRCSREHTGSTAGDGEVRHPPCSPQIQRKGGDGSELRSMRFCPGMESAHRKGRWRLIPGAGASVHKITAAPGWLRGGANTQQ